MFRRIVTFGAVLAFGAGAFLMGAPAATAMETSVGSNVVSPMVCANPGTVQTIVSKTPIFIRGTGEPTHTLQPGFSVSYTTTTSGTITATVTAGTSAEIGSVVAKAKVEVSGSLAQSVTWNKGLTLTATNTTTTAKTVALGAYGYKVTMRTSSYISPCTLVSHDTTVNIPSNDFSWGYV